MKNEEQLAYLETLSLDKAKALLKAYVTLFTPLKAEECVGQWGDEEINFLIEEEDFDGNPVWDYYWNEGSELAKEAYRCAKTIKAFMDKKL